jgi:predicted GIY-YIG superfamily endonuclease
LLPEKPRGRTKESTRGISAPSEKYVGLTSDLRERLKQHNTTATGHTAKFAPWTVVTYVAFSDADKAAEFEIYLKQGSGHAFANKRLW